MGKGEGRGMKRVVWFFDKYLTRFAFHLKGFARLGDENVIKVKKLDDKIFLSIFLNIIHARKTLFDFS